MTRARSTIFGAMIAALLMGPAHAAKPGQCVTPAEVESVALVLMPDILRGLGESCAAHLPAAAFLRRGNESMLARYDAEVESAWPHAKDTLLKIAGATEKKELDALMDVKFGRTLLAAFVVPGLTAGIKPEECGTVSHMVEMLEPLPARNVAGIFAAILQLAHNDKDDGNDDDLPICPLVKTEG